MTPDRKGHHLVGLAAVVVGWANLLIRLALAGFLISYGYYAWAIVGGYLGAQNNVAVNPNIVSNLRLMGTLLLASCTVGTICLIYLTLEEVAWSVLAGGLGAGVFFGTPFLILSYVHSGLVEALNVVRDYTSTSGEVMLFLVGLRIIFEVVDYLRTGPTRHLLDSELAEKRKQARGAAPSSATAKVWGRCWELPYCHEAVREKCPTFIAKKSCWKFGYGCMCNPKLIEVLVRASTGGHTTAAKAREGAYIRSDLDADLHIGQKERTIPCSRCPIFVEHQRQKYKLVNPIIVGATILGLVAGYGPIMVLYRHFLANVSEVAARMTLTGNIDPSAWFRYLDTTSVRVFFYVIAGTLFLAYVLKSVEWLILHRKLL
jgi:hypothetical protein